MPRIRSIEKDDLSGLKVVIDSNALFPSELLEEMTADYFRNAETTDIWLTMKEDGAVMAVVYCAPERMTEGTYNLYLIAVHKDFQGKGFGTQIMNDLEERLRKDGNRILIVETSGLPEFESPRKFYHRLNYRRVAVIPDFYARGDDKIVFWKNLDAENEIDL